MLVAGLLSAIPAQAARSGQVRGLAELTNRLESYGGSSGKVHYYSDVSLYGRAITATDDESIVQNLYAKATLSNDDTGRVYGETDVTDHYVTETETDTISEEFPADPEDPEIPIQAVGYAAVRFTDDTTDDAKEVWVTKAGGDERSAKRESTFGIGKEDEVQIISNARFKTDLSDFQYAAFSEIFFTDDFDESALEDIIRDIYIDIEAGDYLPFGIFYNEDTAYTLQQVDDSQYKLVKYSILENVNQYSKDVLSYTIEETMIG